MGKTTTRSDIKYEEVEMSNLMGDDDPEDGNTEDDIVWLSDNDDERRKAAPLPKPRLSCFQTVLLFFIFISAAAVIGWWLDFGEVLDFASPFQFVTNAPTASPTTFTPTLAPTSETTIFTTTSTKPKKANPYKKHEAKSRPTARPMAKPTPPPTATEDDESDTTSPPTNYPTNPVTIEDHHDKTTTTNTIVDGVDDSEIYCEDLSIYEKWHKRKVTRKDGIMYRVVEQMDHDGKSFTQGLTYARGKLFESAGLYRKSSVRILDPDTANVELKVPMDDSYFAEGMTYFKDTLVQITWKSQKAFIYNVTNLEQIASFDYETTKNEGWGITWDRCNDELIVTDGSANLHFWDPETLKEIRRVEVTRIDGTPATKMNEIEFWRGRVLANVWYEDVVLVIDPKTGKVEKEYDFSQLFPKHYRKIDKADVLNGISISDTPDTLYFTGKLWDRIFRIQLLPDL